MSFESMLNHKCDVYHIKRADASPGYGLPTSPSFSYPETPDISGLPCHFNVKSGSRVVVQMEPQANYEAKIKLNLPLGADIRLNDKIIDASTAYEYTAEIPITIQAHHMYVMLKRTTAQERV
jgi:hypothetical protein